MVKKTAKTEKAANLDSGPRIQDWSPQKVAYYSSLRAAYHNNAHTETKSILTLCTAGIGLLITLCNVLPVISKTQFALIILDAVLFLITIIMSLRVFYYNAAYLDALIRKCNSSSTKAREKIMKEIIAYEKKLEKYDRLMPISFISAVIVTLVFSTVTIYEKCDASKGVCNVRQQEKTTRSKTGKITRSETGKTTIDRHKTTIDKSLHT
jgi:hypothetical protein